MSRQKAILVLLILFLLSSGLSYATTHTVSSPYDDSDVQAVIDNASCVTGDVVYIPACNVVWDTTVSIPDSKKITIQGAGSTSTVITKDSTAFAMNESGSRITAIGFILPEGASDPNIAVKGIGFRIDHCKFTNNTGSSRVSIYVTGVNTTTLPVGLIDNNTFIEGRIGMGGMYALLKPSVEWAKPTLLGTVDSVYIEDNYFYKSVGGGGNLVDANAGASYVARYNTINGITQIQAHSLQSGDSRGTRNWEIYKNTFTVDYPTYSSAWTAMFIRGGTGVIWGNTYDSRYTAHVLFDNVRSFTSYPTSGQCNGSSDWDGNEEANGWPCRDQIGRGTDEWLWTIEKPHSSQAYQPAYLWLNREGGNIGTVIISNNCDDWIQSDRDYFNEVSSFNGTTGVGSGVFASRPATCTTGTAYWATDAGGNWNKTNGTDNDGCLYKCTATNTWTLYYTPYTYPHPLSTTLTPPRNLGISK